MSALIPTLPLPTACGSSTFSGSKGKGKASTRWTASDAEMPPTWLALVATSMEEEHYDIALQTLATFCNGEYAPSVTHLLILLHLSLTTPSSSHPPSLRRSALNLLSRITTLNSPRSVLAAIPPNTNPSLRYHDMRDLSRVEQLGRGIMRWKSWADGLLGDKVGQVRYRRDEEEEELKPVGWQVGMGKRKRGAGRNGRKGAEEQVKRAGRVEEESWWEVTGVLVGVWERDLRECWEWEPALESMNQEESDEEAPKQAPLPLFLHQFPTDGSDNPRNPRSDISRLAEIIFCLYPADPTTPAPTKRNPVPVPFVEDEMTVDLSVSEEFGVGEEKDEAEETRMLARREIAGRMLGMILQLFTPPPASHHSTTRPYLDPSRALPYHLHPRLALLPTAYLPMFFSLIPRTTSPQPVLSLLASLLPGSASTASSDGVITPDVFISDILPPGKTRAKVSLRTAVVKLLIMGYLNLSERTFEAGWREGFGLSEFVEEGRGPAWTWVEQMIEARVKAM